MDDDQQRIIALSTLERYTGSEPGQFQPYIMLANFPEYVAKAARLFNVEVTQGSAMTACHSPAERISMVHYGVGSPLAALIVDLLSFIQPHAVLSLGFCGGLRGDIQEIGEYFNPIAAIREEGTSMAYLPERCPSLSSFVIQRYVCQELENNSIKYHLGVIHTTNVRFWEFNETFKKNLLEERSQAIDMESATLFTVGFARRVPVGALMLITDLPLERGGVKTKESSRHVVAQFSDKQIQIAIDIMRAMRGREQKYTF